MKKLIAVLALALPVFANAGWFDIASESYLTNARHMGNNVYQCTYKTNPGNRGWGTFNTQFQGGCPKFVLYNARNGQVTVPRR